MYREGITKRMRTSPRQVGVVGVWIDNATLPTKDKTRVHPKKADIVVNYIRNRHALALAKTLKSQVHPKTRIDRPMGKVGRPDHRAIGGKEFGQSRKHGLNQRMRRIRHQRDMVQSLTKVFGFL